MTKEYWQRVIENERRTLDAQIEALKLATDRSTAIRIGKRKEQTLRRMQDAEYQWSMDEFTEEMK